MPASDGSAMYDTQSASIQFTARCTTRHDILYGPNDDAITVVQHDGLHQGNAIHSGHANLYD